MSNFLGGMGEVGLDSRHMKPEEAVITLNCDLFKKKGALHATKENLVIDTVTLEGVAVPIHARHKFRGVDLVHAGENLYYGNMNIPVRAYDSTSPMVAKNYEDNVYLTNGKEYLKMSVDNAGAVTFSTPVIPKPTTAEMASVALAEVPDGLLEKGTHQYLFTFVSAFNSLLPFATRDESPPDSPVSAASKTRTLTGDKKKITISDLPTRTGFNLQIYRWRVESLSFEFRLVTEITDDATSFTDNVHQSQLGDILKTQDYITPPVPLDLELFNNNMILSGIRDWNERPVSEIDNYIFWSDNRRMSGYDPFFLDVSGESDDQVMSTKVLNNTAFTFTKGRAEALIGTQARQYRESTQQARTGQAAQFGIINTITHGLLLLGSDRSLHIFDGFRFDEETDLFKMDGLFAKDSTHPHRMNWDARAKVRMVLFNQIVRMAYPSVDSIVNDKVLVMDLRAFPRIIFTIDDYEATSFYEDIPNNKLFAGNSAGQLLEIGQGENYLPVTWKSGDVDGGDVHADKTYSKLYVDMNSHGRPVTANLTVDDRATGDPELKKATRGAKFSDFKSFTNPNKGTRANVQFSWDAGSEDVTLYDYEINIPRATKA